jgi:hypothetical protein
VVSDRSYENKRPGQQLYAVIEFCTKRETAWGKIGSGKYDWLGMKGDTFVFGRPQTPHGLTATVVGDVTHPGADGSHVVEVRTPTSTNPSRTLHTTAADARAAFRDEVARLQVPDGSSGMWKLRLIIDRQLVDEEFVVRTLPNIL